MVINYFQSKVLVNCCCFHWCCLRQCIISAREKPKDIIMVRVSYTIINFIVWTVQLGLKSAIYLLYPLQSKVCVSRLGYELMANMGSSEFAFQLWPATQILCYRITKTWQSHNLHLHTKIMGSQHWSDVRILVLQQFAKICKKNGVALSHRNVRDLALWFTIKHSIIRVSTNRTSECKYHNA